MGESWICLLNQQYPAARTRMDLTQRLDWEDEEEESAVERHRPVGNLHMFAGTHGPAQDFPIYPGSNVIGRHSSCDITLPAQSVSKKHAVLCVTGDCHTICDNGSLNKTRRSKVALEPDVRYSLSNGDFLLFADVACRYTILKKIEVETTVAEESEDDSMLVPGTQAPLAIEKTPGAAIRRMGRGAVLARDSGDEDEEVQRGWSDGGEGGSKDALRTSRPDADTIVPESDEENDTSSSGTCFTSIHLLCDSDTTNRGTPTKESSVIPSSMDRFTPAVVNEPAKEESSRLLQTNKDEKPVGEQTDEEKELSSVGRDVVLDSRLLEERKETSKDGADDRLTCIGGMAVQKDTLDSELKDGGTKAITRSNSHEDKNLNNAANAETPEVSSTSSHCLKDVDETSRRDIAATTTIEMNPVSHTQEEDNLKSTEEKLKVAADLCLDSDTDSDEDVPTTSGTDVKKKDDLEIKSDKAPEQSIVDGTSDAGVHMDRDASVDEEKEKISAVQHGEMGEINTDSDTDLEDDKEMSETGHAESRTGNGNSEVHKVHSGTNVSTGFDIDSDTDDEDADITRSEGKRVEQESREFVEEKKEQFHLDSDTDVEDNRDVSSTKVRKGDSDSVADVPLKETKDGIHMDSDTDVEEDVDVSSTDVTKGKQTLNVDVQEGFNVDSDTDVEDVDVSSIVVTKEKQDSNNSVKDAREGLPLDSDTDVDEEDQGPGASSAAVQSRTTESHIDEMVKNEKEAVGVTIKEAAVLHFDSDTDVDEDDGTSTGPKKAGGSVKTDAEKNEAEAPNEANALHMDRDTDVDENDTSMSLNKSQTAEGEFRSDGVSEGGDGNLDKVAGSVGVIGEIPKADTNTGSVQSNEEEAPKADSQGADYELMATQCFLEPQEPEEDLPDEEEATQAYILSSTWAEPDTFKRPSDPVGVLQMSAVMCLSRSRKKEQPEGSTKISTEKVQLSKQAAPAAHSAPEETAELHAGELGQSGPRIVVPERREEIEPEKEGRRRRGGRRKAIEESETEAKTKNELVIPTASRKRSSRIAMEAEPSTSEDNEIRRKQPSRKSIVKMQEEEKQDESKKGFGSAPEKYKKSDVFETLSDNHPEKIGLRSEFANVTGPTSMELSVGQMESNQERDVSPTLLEPNEDKNVSTSSKMTESNESRILDLPEQSETVFAPKNKNPVRGKRQTATKTKQDNTQETISNDVADEAESKASGANLETQDDFKIPTPRTNDLQDGGNKGPRGRRTRTSHISTSEPLEHEKPEGANTKASRNEVNKTCPGDQNSANTRQRRTVKEEAKEDSQKEEQAGRSKRAINLRGNQKNKETNSEHTLEDNSGSSSLPKRTRKHSKEEMPESDAPEVGNIEEDDMGKLPRRTRKSYKEQKLDDNKGSLESCNTAEAQTTKRTQRGSKGKDIVDKEETVKETVTRKRRNSKSEDTQLGEDQGKRSARTRRLSKEEVVEETTTDTTKENTAGQNTPRRTRRNVKADEKTESEHAGDLKPKKELSESERSSSKTRRKTSTEDSGKETENTEVEEKLSEGTKKRADEETSRKGRTSRTSAKEEPPQVSTPVANRKRVQALKADVDLKRKKSDETSEAKEEIPAGRRGRPRKLSTTDDSQTSAGGSREISTPEPSPSRSSRLRQSPALSNLAEVLTPKRTGRLSVSTLTASPYIPQSGVPPKVLFTGVVDAMGEEIIRSLGGDIADSVFDCTHLITDRVRRTVKFLCALARGIPIVTLDWIDKCKKSGCFLSHTKFLVKDKEQEKNFNFVLSQSLQKAKRSPLFEGYEIHITPSVKPDPELMKDIVSCSGATFLPKMPRTFKEKCVIVSCPKDAARCKSAPSRIPVTTAEFILSGILRQEVNPSAYLLSSEMEDNAPAPAKSRR
ncbi:mediator of DNA damage checkpoint protein 1 isoform X3 [Lithobates pipiens]